MIFITVEH